MLMIMDAVAETTNNTPDIHVATEDSPAMINTG